MPPSLDVHTPYVFNGTLTKINMYDHGKDRATGSNLVQHNDRYPTHFVHQHPISGEMVSFGYTTGVASAVTDP